MVVSCGGVSLCEWCGAVLPLKPATGVVFSDPCVFHRSICATRANIYVMKRVFGTAARCASDDNRARLSKGGGCCVLGDCFHYRVFHSSTRVSWFFAFRKVSVLFWCIVVV